MRWSGTGAAGQQAGQGRPETSDGIRGAGASKGAARLNIQIGLCSDLLTAPNSVVCAGTPGVVLWVQCQNWVQHWGGDGWARQVWWCLVLFTAEANHMQCNIDVLKFMNEIIFNFGISAVCQLHFSFSYSFGNSLFMFDTFGSSFLRWNLHFVRVAGERHLYECECHNVEVWMWIYTTALMQFLIFQCGCLITCAKIYLRIINIHG